VVTKRVDLFNFGKRIDEPQGLKKTTFKRVRRKGRK